MVWLRFGMLVAWLGIAVPGVAFALPTLAIADLTNDTGDPTFDAAGKGVASVLITKFSRLEGIQIVERERLQEVVAEIELGKSGVVDPKTAAKAGKVVGAQYVVLGSIFSVKLPSVSVSLRVVNVETGTTSVAQQSGGADR